MKPIFAALILFAASVANAADNFVSAGGRTDSVHLQTAETYRNYLAVFWTGKPLRSNWYKPCQMTITQEQDGIGAGGATTFAIDRGEVFDWRMSIQGSRARLLDSVIPHEVNHTIFASLARRPLPRWLDEGCSSLFEHATEHARLRTHAKQFMDHQDSAFRRLDSNEYPRGGEGVAAIYGTGFTVVEWLLEQKGVDTLYQFVMDKRVPSQKFRDYYGMTASQAWQAWRGWLQNRDVNALTPIEAEAFAVTARYQSDPNLPTLYVVSTDEFFCPPCHRFKVTDYGGDPNFRERLDRLYNVEFVFRRQRPDLVQKYRITGVPAFCPSNSTQAVIGYNGKEALLAELSRLSNRSIPESAPPIARSEPQPRPRSTPARPRIEPSDELPYGEHERGPRSFPADSGPPVAAAPRQPDQWHTTGCRCSECFAQLNARLAQLEGRLSAVEGQGTPRSEPGPQGPPGKDGIGISSVRLTQAGVLEFKFSDVDQWVSIGKVVGPQGPPGSDATAPDLTQKVVVKDPDGNVIDEDNYALGKQPIVIQLRDNGVKALTSRVENLEPLLPLKKRSVKVFVGEELVDELTGDEALNPGDPLPIYLVPKPKASTKSK